MGIDLVKLQLLIATGQPLSSVVDNLPQDPRTPPPLHSLQLRLTSEDVSNNWSLSVGKISSFRFPTGNGIRIDTHMLPPATIVKTDFDSLLAKIIVTAPTWKDVVNKARRALEDTRVEDVKTNLDVLRGIVWSPEFGDQACDTQWLERSIAKILELGKHISKTPGHTSQALQPTKTSPSTIPSSSNILFRKGDAWSITLTPEPPPTPPPSQTIPNTTLAPPITTHLELTRILRNDFPTTLTATALYTTPTTPPNPLHHRPNRHHVLRQRLRQHESPWSRRPEEPESYR